MPVDGLTLGQLLELTDLVCRHASMSGGPVRISMS